MQLTEFSVRRHINTLSDENISRLHLWKTSYIFRV